MELKGTLNLFLFIYISGIPETSEFVGEVRQVDYQIPILTYRYMAKRSNEWKDVILEGNAFEQMLTGKEGFEDVKV